MGPEAEQVERAAAAFQGGEAAAFSQLVELQQERFYRIAYRIVGDAESALDTVQDAFIKIHDRIGSWDQGGRFSSWATRIVTNQAIDALRRRGRERRAWEARVAEASLQEEDQSDASLAQEELKAVILRVKAAIDVLPPGQRAVVALRHYEGFSLKEIAEFRGCALGTVKSTLHQAFRSLRRSLGGELLQQITARQAS